MKSIGLTVRKLCSKQLSNVAAEHVRRTCSALDRIYQVKVADMSDPPKNCLLNFDS
jgi:hypothetical protein